MVHAADACSIPPCIKLQIFPRSECRCHACLKPQQGFQYAFLPVCHANHAWGICTA